MWELEDLAFRVLEPVVYKNIAKLLDEKREARQQYIDKVITAIDVNLKKILYIMKNCLIQSNLNSYLVHQLCSILLLVQTPDTLKN